MRRNGQTDGLRLEDVIFTYHEAAQSSASSIIPEVLER